MNFPTEEEKIKVIAQVDDLLQKFHNSSLDSKKMLIVFNFGMQYIVQTYPTLEDLIMDMFLERAEKMQMFELCSSIRDSRKPKIRLKRFECLFCQKEILLKTSAGFVSHQCSIGSEETKMFEKES